MSAPIVHTCKTSRIYGDGQIWCDKPSASTLNSRLITWLFLPPGLLFPGFSKQFPPHPQSSHASICRQRWHDSTGILWLVSQFNFSKMDTLLWKTEILEGPKRANRNAGFARLLQLKQTCLLMGADHQHSCIKSGNGYNRANLKLNHLFSLFTYSVFWSKHLPEYKWKLLFDTRWVYSHIYPAVESRSVPLTLHTHKKKDMNFFPNVSLSVTCLSHRVQERCHWFIIMWCHVSLQQPHLQHCRWHASCALSVSCRSDWTCFFEMKLQRESPRGFKGWKLLDCVSSHRDTGHPQKGLWAKARSWL